MPPSLSPEAWSSLRHEWLWVYRGPVPVTGQWSGDITVPPGVFFVERGEAKIHAEDREIVVTSGQAFFSKPGLRRQWFAPGTRLLSVGFRGTWPDGAPLLNSGLNLVLDSPVLHKATLRLFCQIHPGRRVVTYREAILPKARPAEGWAVHDGAFLAWLAIALECLHNAGVVPEPRADRSRRLIDRLLVWINSLPLEQATPSLPPEFSLGPRRSDQLLRQHLGLGLRELWERRRLTTARELVLAGTDPLKSVAFRLGFRHASHFTAWFRRHTGQSPSACRAGGTEAA